MSTKTTPKEAKLLSAEALGVAKGKQKPMEFRMTTNKSNGQEKIKINK